MLLDFVCYIPIISIFHIYIITVKKEKKYYISNLSEINISLHPGRRVERSIMTTNKAMNKKINAIAKSAKKHHGAAITVAVGAALSVAGNLVIGGMTIAKAVKNKKAAGTDTDDDKKAEKKEDSKKNDNNNPPAGGDNQDNQQNQNPAENK